MAEHHRLMAHLLLTLYEQGPLRMGELLPAFVERTGKRPHRATMHRWLKKMETWGFVSKTGRLGTAVRWSITDRGRLLIVLNKPVLSPSEALSLIMFSIVDAALRVLDSEMDKGTFTARLKSHLFYTLPRVLALAAVTRETEQLLPVFRAFLLTLGGILTSPRLSLSALVRTMREELKMDGLNVAAEPVPSPWPPPGLVKKDWAWDEDLDEFIKALREVLLERERGQPGGPS